MKWPLPTRTLAGHKQLKLSQALLHDDHLVASRSAVFNQRMVLDCFLSTRLDPLQSVPRSGSCRGCNLGAIAKIYFNLDQQTVVMRLIPKGLTGLLLVHEINNKTVTWLVSL